MKPRTQSIGAQLPACLIAWLWLAPVADAQSTFTPVPLDDPTSQELSSFGGAVAGIGDVSGDGVPDLLVGAANQTVGDNSVQDS
jgi:hypothetical protein